MRQPLTIATVGELLVEFVSHRKNCGLRQISDYSGPYPSGAPAIFLDQAARMGAKTEMIGGVGNDGFGQCLLQRLRDDGVGVRGVNVSQYVNALRLEHAADLLSSSDESVATIMTRSGFLTRSNFYREFQRRYGQTPAAYRSSVSATTRNSSIIS